VAEVGGPDGRLEIMRTVNVFLFVKGILPRLLAAVFVYSHCHLLPAGSQGMNVWMGLKLVPRGIP